MSHPRGRALLMLAVALALAGIGGERQGNGDAGGRQVAAAQAGDLPQPRLTLRQAVGQRMIFPYASTTPPEGLRKRIGRGEAAGVILFGRNVSSAAHLRAAMRGLQSIERPPGLRAPLLVLVDQEGGAARRLPGSPRRGAQPMARGGTAEVRRQGRLAAETLRGVGANVNLAPVGDFARAGAAMHREGRAFAADHRTVARLSAAFAEGLRRGGVSATAKHFPGFGRARVNTDHAPQRIATRLGTLRRLDGVPFERMIDEGVEIVMMSTAVYPALDPRPAALSSRWVRNELRGRLGFEGVVISDDLQTPAVAGYGAGPRLAQRAVRAGVDLPLFAQDYAGAARAAEGLVDAVRRGTLSRSRIEEGARRVLALRERAGRSMTAR
ncbi:MAG TPA: glycoside hydrolase family 3 N-terminal domain-containing protein [Solirubrobacteraceae bacterium]|nr:glycoside hydrolase family 3 N-terminal domain-containing protein [Solirubrobacteraceae bacterium]